MRYTFGVIPAGRQSTAYGYAQALDGTWKEYRQETGRRFATRDNIRDGIGLHGLVHGQDPQADRSIVSGRP